jgi:hypothetical protein
MKKIQDLNLIELVLFYLALFGIYVMVPSDLVSVRHFIAPVMAILVAVIFLHSLQYLKKR